MEQKNNNIQKEFSENGKKGSKVTVFATFLLVIVIIFAGIFIFMKKQKSKDGTTVGITDQQMTDKSDRGKDRISSDVEFGISFPLVSDDRQRAFSAEKMKDLDVTKFRNNFSWTWLENTKGNLNFTPIGDRLAWADANGLSMFVTVTSRAPSWRCVEQGTEESKCVVKMEDWEWFLEGLFSYMKTYENENGSLPIHAFQFENEWETISGGLAYPGTPDQFAAQHQAMYRISKKYFPDILFYVGGLTRGTAADVAFCTGRTDVLVRPDGTEEKSKSYCDKSSYIKKIAAVRDVLSRVSYDGVDQHLYWEPVSHWPLYIETLREDILPDDKKDALVIVSEFGGPHVGVLANEFCGKPEPCPNLTRENINRFQSQLIVEEVNAIKRIKDIEGAYYFSLTELQESFPAGRFSGLFYIDKERQIPVEKPSYNTFKALIK